MNLSRRLSICVIALAIGCFALGGRLHAGDVQAQIINGTPTDGFASVGVVAYGDNIAAQGFCSGTLIGPDKVLTAAHCTYGENPDQLYFIVGGEAYPVSGIFVHPDFSLQTLNYDVSVLVLAEEVIGVTPSAIATQVPAVGTELTLVGYGFGGTGETGEQPGTFGTKRVGYVKIDYVLDMFLAWDFLPGDDESNTARGDSGGPAFVEVDGELRIAGITSYGYNPTAAWPDKSFDTRIDRFADWIDAPYNGSNVLVYRLAESLRIANGGEASRRRQRGYLVVTRQGGQAFAATEYRENGVRRKQLVELTADQSLEEYAIRYDFSDYRDVLTLRSFTPTTIAWRLASGPATVTEHDYMAHFRQASGVLLESDADGALVLGSLRLRLDRQRTDAGAAIDAGQFARQLLDDLRGDETDPATTPAANTAFDQGGLQVYRLRGQEVLEGGATTNRTPVRGYVVIEGDSRQATWIYAFKWSLTPSLLTMAGDTFHGTVYNEGRQSRLFLAMADTDDARLAWLTGSSRQPGTWRRLSGSYQEVQRSAWGDMAVRLRLDTAQTAAMEGKTFSEAVSALTDLVAEKYVR